MTPFTLKDRRLPKILSALGALSVVVALENPATELMSIIGSVGCVVMVAPLVWLAIRR
jgi:hypothetical protein